MDCLYICNTGTDSISKIGLKDFMEEKKITINSIFGTKSGPHGICKYKDKIYVANSYGNTISLINTREDREREEYYIGLHPSDIKIVRDRAYVTCGEANSVVIFDIILKKIVGNIQVGNIPHSIDSINDKLVVTNMESDSLTIINGKKDKNIKTVKVGPYPTKALFIRGGEIILACESNLGSSNVGSVSLIDGVKGKVLYRIQVGRSPIDLYANDKFCFVSNFGEGTISVINVDSPQEIKKLEVGGRPRGIVREGNFLYIGDNYENLIIRYNLINGEIKKVSVGGEPTGLILIS